MTYNLDITERCYPTKVMLMNALENTCENDFAKYTVYACDKPPYFNKEGIQITNSKKYYISETSKLEEEILAFDESERNFYEVELESQKRKIKFDFDIKRGDKLFEDAIKEKAISLLEEKIREVFTELYGIELEKDDILIFNSSIERKYSYHIVINNYCVHNNVQAREFMSRVRDTWDNKFRDGIDTATYSVFQCFRLLHCCKLDNVNYKRYEGEMENIFLKSLTTNIQGSHNLPLLNIENNEREYTERTYSEDDAMIFDKETIEFIMSKISSNIDRNSWFFLCNAFFNMGATKQMIAEWSKKASNRFDRTAEQMIDKLDTEQFKHNLPYVLNKLKKCLSKNEYKGVIDFLRSKGLFKKMDTPKSTEDNKTIDLEKVRKVLLTLQDEESISEYISKQYSKSVKITYVRRESSIPFGYIWNDESKLWEAYERELLQHMIMKKVIDRYSNENDIIGEDLAQKWAEATYKQKRESKELEIPRLYHDFKRKLTGATGQQNIFRLAYPKLFDKEFYELIDPMDSIWLPLKNGKKYNMMTKELTDRTKSDLFSEEIERNILFNTDDAAGYMISLFGNDGWKRANKITGYLWTNVNDLKMIFIFIGDRDTGKSTFIRLLGKLMGRFFKPLDDKAIMEGRQTSVHNDELAYALKKSFVAVCNETKADQKINEKVAKQICGGDMIALRTCGGNTEKIYPRTKIIIAGNIHPTISGDDTFQEKLMHLVFPNSFEATKENKKKMEDMVTNDNFLDQLFTLQMNGAYEYYQKPTIEKDIIGKEKFIDKNPIEKWLEEGCEHDENNRYPTEQAWTDFCYWRQQNRDDSYEVSPIHFKKILQSKFVKKKTTFNKMNCQCYWGIKQKVSSQVYEENKIDHRPPM